MKKIEDILTADIFDWYPSFYPFKSFSNSVANNVSINGVISVAGLFLPEFIECNNSVFLKENIKKFIENNKEVSSSPFGDEKKTIERYYNLFCVDDFFLLAYDEAYEDARLVLKLGELLEYFWSRRLIELYPNKNFQFELSKDLYDEEGLCLTFWERENDQNTEIDKNLTVENLTGTLQKFDKKIVKIAVFTMINYFLKNNVLSQYELSDNSNTIPHFEYISVNDSEENWYEITKSLGSLVHVPLIIISSLIISLIYERKKIDYEESFLKTSTQKKALRFLHSYYEEYSGENYDKCHKYATDEYINAYNYLKKVIIDNLAMICKISEYLTSKKSVEEKELFQLIKDYVSSEHEEKFKY